MRDTGRPQPVEAAPVGRRKPRRPRAHRVIPLLIVLLIAGLVAILFAPQPLPVDVARVASGPMRVTVSSEGQTRVKERYEVAAPVAGRLLRIPFKAGDRVRSGDVVAVIQPQPPQFNDVRSKAELEAKVRVAEAQYALAQADMARVKAQHDFAVTELNRNRVLQAKGVAAQRTLEQSESEEKSRQTEVIVAEKVVAQRAAELEAAKAMLIQPGPGGQAAPGDTVAVHAPVDGAILKVVKESETIVTAGMPVVEIGNVADLEVELEMLSKDAVKVREGAQALLEGWGGETLNGRVRRVEPFGYTKVSALGIEEQRVHVKIDFTDPREEWQHVGHGYRMNAQVVVWQADNVLKLPMGALFRDGNEWTVFTLGDDGAAHKKRVTVGHLNDTEAEVIAGVSENERVILHPSDRVAEGTFAAPRGG
jgi:HlyD family secretion protein